MAKFDCVEFRTDIRTYRNDILSRVSKLGTMVDKKFEQADIVVDFEDRCVWIKHPEWDIDECVPFENVVQLRKKKDARAEALKKARAAKAEKNADDSEV